MMMDSKEQRNLERRILAHITSNIEDMRVLRTKNVGRDYFCYQGPEDDACYTQLLFDFAIGYYRDNDRLLSRKALVAELKKRRVSLEEGKPGARLVALHGECHALDLDHDAFPALLDQLRETMMLRVMQGLTKEISDSLQKSTPSKAFEKAYNYVTKANVDYAEDVADTKIFNATDGASEIIQEYHWRKEHPELIRGIEIGWQKLDEATLGFKKQTLTLVIGEVNKGKSTVLLNWAADVNQQGKNVIFFSFEMPMWQIKARWLCRQLDITYRGFMGGALDKDDEDKMMEFYKKIGGDRKFDQVNKQSNAGYFLMVDQPDDTSPNFVEQIVKQTNALYGPCDAIFVDYLGIMKSDLGGRSQWWEQSGAAALGLRRIARVHNLASFSAEQINREGLKSGHKKQDKGGFDAFEARPEDIQGWKVVSDTADNMLGFNSDPDLRQMNFYRIKGRDWVCDPFTVKWEPERCLIRDLDGPTSLASRYMDSSAAMFNNLIFDKNSGEIMDDGLDSR